MIKSIDSNCYVGQVIFSVVEKKVAFAVNVLLFSSL